MGYMQLDTLATPANPASGNILVFGNNSSNNLNSLDFSGITRAMAQLLSGVTNTFLSGLNADGTWATQAAGYAMWDGLCIDGGTVASAATTNLSTMTGNSGIISGTTTITAITLAQGNIRFMRFTGALTLTNNASIVLPGGQSITTVAGDWAIFVGQSGAVVRCIYYQKTNVAGAMTKQALGGFGFLTGAGGTVTQATNKSTGVTLNANCGQITMNNAAMLTLAIVGFTLTNSAITAADSVQLQIVSGGTVNSYFAFVDAVASGSCHICVQNISLGSLSEAVVLGFVVIKGVTA